MALNYLPRVVDAQLLRALRNSGAVLVKGPKWSGKTATSLQQAASALFLQDPDYSPGYLATADTKPSLLLQGEQPRLIDEWQMAPQLWDAVRFAVDRQGGTGLFILTGSTTPTVTGSHSGVGRIAHLVMRTMSLFESQDSSGEISLARIFHWWGLLLVVGLGLWVVVWWGWLGPGRGVRPGAPFGGWWLF